MCLFVCFHLVSLFIIYFLLIKLLNNIICINSFLHNILKVFNKYLNITYKYLND